MTDIYFSTNPAEWTKLEGLYISERNPPGFIQGIDTSVVGFATRCVRGPTIPIEITTPGRFLEVFGGRDYTANGTGGALIGQGWAALLNKKFGKVVVRRVVSSTAVAASFDWETAAGGGGTAVLRIAAANPGLWGNDVQFKVSAASDGVATKFNLTIRYLGKEVLYANLNINTASDDNLAVSVGVDEANLVVLTKLANGRPVNTAAGVDGADTDAFVNLGETVASFTSVAGTEPALVVGDYTAGINDLAVFPGVGVVLTPEASPTPATFHSNLVTKAAEVADRIFLTWAQAHGQSASTEAAQVVSQITTRSDRIWWAYNSAFTIDADTKAEIQTAPHVWLASILSQIHVSIHAGAAETRKLLAGIKRLTATALSRPDLILLRNAGVCALERGEDGFQFRSVITTDLTPGKTEGSRRRIADYLQGSASKRLVNFVKAKNTIINRATMAAELTAFSRAEQNPETGTIEEFVIEQVTVNTPAQRGVGLEKLLWRVRIINHILFLVFETEIGTGVTIEQQAA